MISVIHEGQLYYMTKIEDFRDVMESSVYDGLISALATGFSNENWKEKYNDLQKRYDQLEIECEDLENIEDELDDTIGELKELRYQNNSLLKEIKQLLFEYNQRYISNEDLVFSLERVIGK